MHNLAKKISKCIETKVESIGIDNIDKNMLEELSEWVDVIKDLAEYDKNMRIIEAMDEADKEDMSSDDEDETGRMGYRGRDSRGRFVHRPGRGRSAGYTRKMMPTMDDHIDEYMGYYPVGYSSMGYSPMGYGSMGYSENRGMGYTESGNSDSVNRRGYNESGQGNSENGRYGYTRNDESSRYGRSYDSYKNARRGYTKNQSPEEHQKMKESINEVFTDLEEMVTDVWKDVPQEDKAKYKQKFQQMMTKMV